jgi:hypothetical protein
MIQIIEPQSVVAVGRKAEDALKMVNYAPQYVRHPSMGGSKMFELQMKAVFKAS